MTDPTLAIIVMAHPRRRARAELLAQYVKADVIVWDHEQRGEWSTGARAWLAASEFDTTHALVIQDDAEPVANLRKLLIQALTEVPDTPISLYLGQKKPSRWAPNVAEAVEEADVVGANWIAASHLLHGVAIVLRHEWITPMLQWAELSNQPYDQRIGRYLRLMRNRRVLYTWPSMVDHDDTVPTLVRHADDKRLSPGGRIAYRVGVPASFSPVIVQIETPPGAEE